VRIFYDTPETLIVVIGAVRANMGNMQVRELLTDKGSKGPARVRCLSMEPETAAATATIVNKANGWSSPYRRPGDPLLTAPKKGSETHNKHEPQAPRFLSLVMTF
jgi:hypothetical protein